MGRDDRRFCGRDIFYFLSFAFFCPYYLLLLTFLYLVLLGCCQQPPPFEMSSLYLVEAKFLFL